MRKTQILFLKRDKIGDALLLTPTLRHLREAMPEAVIDVLANDYNAWVFRDNPNIDNLHVYPRTRHAGHLRPKGAIQELLLTFKLRRVHYDFVIVAGGVISPRAISRGIRLGGKRTVAFADEGVSGLSDPLTLIEGSHEVDSNHRLLTPLGIKPPVRRIYPELQLNENWVSSAKKWCVNAQVSNEYIVLGINSRKSKRKPTFDQILSWSNYVLKKWNLKTVLVWQPGEESNKLYPGDDSRIREFCGAFPAHLKLFGPRENIYEVMGLIWGAQITIVPDGGLAHLASVSPGGVIALFADTSVSPHPDNWKPYSRRGFYLEGPSAVEEIPDRDLFNLLDKLLSNKTRENIK